jgi:hypothetical protein
VASVKETAANVGGVVSVTALIVILEVEATLSALTAKSVRPVPPETVIFTEESPAVATG